MGERKNTSWGALGNFKKSLIVVGAVILFGTIGNFQKHTASPSMYNGDVKSSIAPQDATTKKQVVVEEKIPFKTSEQNDASLNKNETKVKNEGIDGTRKVTYEVVYKNGVETGRVEIRSEVTREPVDKVVLLGTYVAPQLPSMPTQPQPLPNTNAYYANCSEARAAGVAPIYEGQPGYRSGLDRDHDGIACEL